MVYGLIFTCVPSYATYLCANYGKFRSEKALARATIRSSAAGDKRPAGVGFDISSAPAIVGTGFDLDEVGARGPKGKGTISVRYLQDYERCSLL